MKRTPMKRSPMPSRKSRIRSVNPEKKAKRKARKPRLKASVRKAVLARDGHQCTQLIPCGFMMTLVWKNGIREPYRCPETESLHVHEKRYPADVDDCVTLCKWHHMELEARIRPWNFR